MPATPHTKRLLDGLRRQLDAVIDAQVRDLVAAWARAWDEVAPDLLDALLDIASAAPDGKVTRSMVIRSSRMQQALAVIADQLHILADAAGVRLTQDVEEIVRQAGEAQAAIIATQLPSALDLQDLEGWDRVDPAQLAAIVQRTTQQITARTKPLGVDAYDVVRRELVRGIASGSNPRATAQRIVQRAEGKFNGGLNRALVIARTEMLDAHRAAAALGQEQNADVLAGWEWSAHLDGRTCPACWARNGTVHDLAEAGPLGHPQCRCARLPRVKSWAELGFPDIEEPPDALPDSEALFARLPDFTQRQILGPARWEAWRDGRFPMSAWAVRRNNPGWRDSYQAAPAPKGGSKRRRRITNPPPVRPTAAVSTPTLDKLPKSSSVGTAAQEILQVNPRFGQPGYDVNCVHVVNAFEMRLRGYDVQATALPRSMWRQYGRNAVEALQRWTTPTGGARRFTRVTRAELAAEVKSWPDGARGWVIVEWRGGGGHIFSVVNDGGRARYLEGQNVANDPAAYWPLVKRGGILIVRTDDLTPTDAVREFITRVPKPKGGKP